MHDKNYRLWAYEKLNKIIKKNLTLDFKTSVVLFLVVFIIITATVMIFLKQLRNTITKSNNIYFKEIVIQSSNIIKSKIKGDFETLQTIAYIAEENNIVGTENFPLLLKHASSHLPEFVRLGYVNKDKKYFSTTNNHILIVDSMGIYQQAMNGKSVISDTFAYPNNNVKINVFAVPVHKNGIVDGFIFATINNDYFKKFLTIPFFGGNVNSYILKQDGSIIAKVSDNNKNSKIANVFDKYADTFSLTKDLDKIKSDFKSGISGTLKCQINNSTNFLIYAPIGINDWVLAISIPQKFILKTYNYIVAFVYLFTFIIFTLFGIILCFNIKLQTRNIKHYKRLVYNDNIINGNTWEYFKEKGKEIISKNNTREYLFILFDFNKFYVINDLFGWEFGTRVLRYTNNVLSSMLNDNEICARYTCDNFVLLIEDRGEEILKKRMAEFKEKLNELITNENIHYEFKYACGIYEFKDDTDFEAMYNKANFTRKIVRKNKNSFYEFYNEEKRQNFLFQKDLENEMHSALESNQFVAYLQPKYNINTNTIVGAEALVRWIHPEKGLIPPNDFIPLFEKNGFISNLDLYIFETACREIRKWLDEKKKPVVISVNISRVNFHNPDLVDVLSSIVQKYKIPFNYLEIEITESALFEDTFVLINTIRNMRQRGFTVSIDDFGTGYSSMTFLKNIEVDVLKLDREFFNFTLDIERSKKVLTSILKMAKSLNITAVSEGVETEEQIALLKEIGCDIAQGFYYARPMPLSDFRKLTFESKDSISVQ